jgi:glutaredoxin-like protein
MLLEEIAELSEKISFIEKDLEIDKDEAKKYGVTLAPSFVILDNEGKYKGVKFNGIPAGHEINSFLSAVIDMSGVEFGFDKDLVERIKKIKKPINIKVFVTLSCPHCPGAVSNAHRLAMLNDNIESEMIEAQTFQELSVKYKVSGVPKIIINEKHELVGNQPIEEYLNKLERL